MSTTLHVPAALASALTGQRACYQGAFGGTDTCDISASTDADGSATVTAQAQGLKPFETMTIAVGFTAGTFVPFDPSYLASPWGWVQGLAGLGVLGALITVIVTRVRRLGDAPGRPVIIAEYTPPAQIDALQAAVMLGRSTKAIPAEVLEQAVVGSIRIVEGERRLFGGHKLQAELVDPSRADRDGRMLLSGLFGDDPAPGAVFEFGRSDTRFSSAARSILSWADKNLTVIGLRRPVPRRQRGLPLLLSGVFGAITLVAGILALAADVSPAVPVLLFIFGIAVFIASAMLLARKPLSAEGAEVRDHLKGLQVFIEWAEADRIRMLQSPEGAERVPVDVNDPRQMLKLYESLLPYAVVFGQEKQWAQRLAVMYTAGYGATAVPYWYVGTHGFDADAFSAGIGSLSSAASSASSTSGGSGGGGSAGGGGGGGGGGGV
ncbi:DUF2207 domain-containing protein [Microbacterium elymi]|uniref:DUF2207 domain-containing protein n=1 Tax=Microbacterium elymi TaxID=2909587 RepID=A0ABY5NHZ2_9MICO|nr:DUF2207 domain-containing protein [Microbacterium elymi]UUT34731.1 DUF2207 domain-containing protein [Microbacterium elymi]